MPISLYQCSPTEHDYDPIVEGGQTVGLKCRVCGKIIREFMQYSNIEVTPHGEILNLQSIFPQINSKRKDPRF